MTDENTKFIVRKSNSLQGDIRVPGDKSISHRSVMLGALADGQVEVNGFLEGDDALATLNAFRQMGVVIENHGQGRLTIHGVGLHGLSAPESALDLGNSGTSMRLLAGLLAGQSFSSTLTGDSSLSGRPMCRVTEPLGRMGATIESSAEGTAPLRITGNPRLAAIDYQLPVASAQIKSCLLLAGLYAAGTSCVTEPAATRDHTERMLSAFSYPPEINDSRICITGPGKLKATRIDVPADISSAAFFMVGAAIADKADVCLLQVGVNPTRTGVIEILRLMGADITLENETTMGAEPVANIRVRSSALKGIDIPESLVPLAIDEFPVLFIAAACAQGPTRLSGAAELRVKESDRIQVMADGLQLLGIDARATADGMIINPGSFGSGRVESHGDHRIAMAFAIAGLQCNGSIEITECDNVATSFPGFASLAQAHGLQINVELHS